VTAFTESVVEEATLAWLEELGYAVLHGPAIATANPTPNIPNQTIAFESAEGRSSRAA